MTAVRWCEAAAAVAPRIAAADRLFCFLDFDGTLARLAPTPCGAAPLPGTATLLSQLAAAPGTELALITGRTIADLRRRLDVPKIHYVGIHGANIELPDGTIVAPATAMAVRPIMAAIARELHEALRGRPGVRLEDKGVAIACHYRLASRADARATAALVAALVHKHQHRDTALAITHGHEVIEIHSAAANKGTAVSTLLAKAGAGTLALYVGDDETDEDAFMQLPADAITVRVGPARVATAARYRVGGPVEVHRLLRVLLACRAAPWRRTAEP